MSINTRTEAELARVLCNPDLARDLVSNVNTCVTGASAAGSAGAIQASNGSAGFVDSGVVATAGSITTGGWAGTAIPVAKGGTGATSAGAARTALGVGAVATVVAALASTTNIDAVPGSFADLAAVQTYLAGANVIPNIETRLDNLESKANAILSALKAAGLMASS